MPQEGIDTQAAIPLEDCPIEMMFQRSWVTLAQLLATPIMPKTQTPPTLAANAPVAIQIALVTIATTPARETRSTRKCLRGASQSSIALDSENSPPPTPTPDLRGSQVDAVGASAYVHTFMVDRVPFPAMDRVRP